MRDEHYSKSYSQARRRFVEAATRAGATIHSYPINVEYPEELAIEVATLGHGDTPTLVTSSGVHGVEGFFGSAVQHALLDRLSETGDSGLRYVFIHSLNPYGFAAVRRFNEDNVDLNRNFHVDPDAYRGAPDGYAQLDRLLNPARPPSQLEPFRLIAIWNVWRHGLQTLKQSVAGGQYEYPAGLFFGGHGPSKSAEIVFKHCDDWIGQPGSIVHIDFHTGLGRFGTYQLLLSEPAGSNQIEWYAEHFGAEHLEPADASDAVAYRVNGMFGQWMQEHFANKDYRMLGAEFGTYDPIRVLGAVRAENCAHHYGDENSRAYRSAKAQLLECFCPAKAQWREQVLQSSLKIIEQAERALAHLPT